MSTEIRHTSTRRVNWRGPLLLLLLTTCAFWKLVLTKQYTFLESPDPAHQILPWLQVQAAALRQGTIAIWDPYHFGGQSLIGQMQPGVTSPFTYLLLVFPLHSGQVHTYFVHIWLALIHFAAALFAYWLFRDLGCRMAASVLGAMFYTLAGFSTIEWPQILAASIWAPLVFLFLLRSLDGRRPLANAGLAGLFLGLSWLSGHHQPPLFLSLAVVCIFVFFLVRRPGFRRRLTTCAGVLFLITGLTAAVQVLPALEYGRLAMRWTASGALDWKAKVQYPEHEQQGLRATDVLGMVIPGSSSSLATPFVGVVGISFAALGLALASRKRGASLLLVVGIGALLFSMPRYNVLHGLFYVLVPLVEKARSPAMAICVTQVCVAGLVAFGGDAFLAARNSPWVRRVAVWLSGFGALTLGMTYLMLFLAPTVQSHLVAGDDRIVAVGLISLLLAGLFAAYARGHLAAGTAVAFACVLLLIEQGTSIGFAWPHKNEVERTRFLKPLFESADIAAFLRRQPDPGRVEVNRDDVAFNFGDWYGIETIEGYTPSMPAQFVELNWWNARVRQMYGVRYAIAKSPMRPGQEEVFTSKSGLKVFRNADAFPPVWSVHRVETVPDRKQATELVRDGSLDLRQTGLLLDRHAPALEECSQPDQIGQPWRGLNWISVDVEMGCRGLVIAGANYAPGWQVRIDGKPAGMMVVNTLLRGVVVPQGRHRIEMVYRPLSVYGGFTLTVAGLTLAFLLHRRREMDRESLLAPMCIAKEARAATGILA